MEGAVKLLEMFQALNLEAKRAIVSSSIVIVTAAYLYIAGRNKKEPPKQK
ncbi:MAG: hypothetical protein AAB441_01780 [Patescibacteria group bacterium]